MNIDLLQALLLCDVTQSLEVLDMRMDPAIRYQTHQVHLRAYCLCFLQGLQQDRILVQFAIRYGLVNTGELLIDDTTGTNIEVTHF